MKVKPIPSEHTYDWLLNKHYAKRIPSISYAFGLFDDKKLKGVITFGSPPIQMNNGHCVFNKGDLRLNKEQDTFSVRTLELNRLVVEDNLPKNTLSFFVSQTLKQLPRPLCIVSYADPTNGHHGYIYQATNWIYTGQAELGGKSVSFFFNDKEWHGRNITKEFMKKQGIPYDDRKSLHDNWKDGGGLIVKQKEKHRYFMFLGSKVERKRMYKKFKYKIYPYPKGENTRYDASYKPLTTDSLF